VSHINWRTTVAHHPTEATEHPSSVIELVRTIFTSLNAPARARLRARFAPVLAAASQDKRMG
jgi:hypothetical protein